MAGGGLTKFSQAGLQPQSSQISAHQVARIIGMSHCPPPAPRNIFILYIRKQMLRKVKELFPQ
jgi:hypothetical protein